VSESPTRKIGAIGMCYTGIQPLAMLRCKAVVAPVLCQPAVPFSLNRSAAADLGLPPDVDLQSAESPMSVRRIGHSLLRRHDFAARVSSICSICWVRLKYCELT
jgi:hypothetical protein